MRAFFMDYRMDNVTTSKYQLRRMFLINAGTNKALPSNRITVVDPRGGALVAVLNLCSMSLR